MESRSLHFAAIAQNIPGHVGPEFLAANSLALRSRRTLDRRAFVRRHATIRVEPRPDVSPVGVAAGDSECGLSTKDLGRPVQCGLFGCQVRDHSDSLRVVDPYSQSCVDHPRAAHLSLRMPRDQITRSAIGKRLATARALAKLSQSETARLLTADGYKYVKGSIGAWEHGRNIPDALVICKLAEIFSTTVDALLVDKALSAEAIRFAKQFDGLDDEHQRAFRGMWEGYFKATESPDKPRGTRIDDSQPARRAARKKVAR